MPILTKNCHALSWVLFALVAFLFLEASQRRPLWEDETYGQATAFSQSYSSLITGGSAGQCSRAPLPPIIQKVWLGIWPGAGFSDTANFRLFSRLPSLFFGLAFLALVLLQAGKIAPVFAPLLLVTLAADPNFITHITEDRPYTAWILYSAVLLHQVYLFALGWESRWTTLLILLSSVLAALTAAGSNFLLAGLLGGAGIYLNWKRVMRLLAFFAPALLLGTYYALLSDCVNHTAGDPANLDVLYQWRHGDTFLLRRASLEMIFQYKYFSQFAGNLLLAAGVILFVRQKPSGEFASRAPFLFTSLVLAFLLCGAAVAFKGYYFVPRIFIFLLAGRALLLLIASTLVRNWLGGNARLKTVGNSCLLIMPVILLVWLAYTLRQ